MLFALLILLDIPLFLAVAWVVFDSKENAAETIWETVTSILKILFIPKIVRVFTGMDDTGAIGLFPIAVFIGTCIAIVYGEVLFIQHYFPGWINLEGL